MPDNTINENYIYDTRFKDYFYGSDDHYQHPGWYFDKVINSLDNLEGLKNQVYTNRFVLVYKYHAIFMRTNDNNSYYFVKPWDNNFNYVYDYKKLNGHTVNAARDSIVNNLPEKYKEAVTKISGFQFISYTNKIAQTLLRDGSLPYIDEENPQLYNTTSNLQYMASYYFGL